MSEILLKTVIIALAAYQIVDLLVYQDGPYNIFVKIRNMFGLYEINGENHIDESNGYNLIANILSCPYCTNVWVTIFLFIFTLIFGYNVLIPFSAMGIITILLDRLGAE